MSAQNPLAKGNSSEMSDFVAQYSRQKPLYDEFTDKLVDLFKALLGIRHIDVHLIEGRAKDIDSFREKISRSSKKYSDPINEITDLSGIRIIVYYEDDLDSVCRILEEEFEVDKANSIDKRSALKPEEFGYQSVHYVIRLLKSRSSLLEWQHLATLKAEVQIRTVLQHSWAAISHKLQYKREEDIPQVLRRRLFRLSALLELADESFMFLRNQTIDLSQRIEKQLLEGNTNIEINILTLEEFIRTSHEVKQLVKYATQSGFSFDTDEFDDGTDEIDERETLSDLVAISNQIGIKTISSLKEVIQDSLAWAPRYLRAQYKASESGWLVSPGFVCILIIIGKFRGKFDNEDLIKFGWYPEIVSRVLRIASSLSLQ